MTIGPYYAEDSMYWKSGDQLINIFNERQREAGLPELRLKNGLCENCDGEGKMVNRSIDGQGLSPNDPDLDDDFWEDYFGGRYDVVCDHCKGNKVVKVVDEERTPLEVLEAWDEYQQDQWDMVQENLSELRMGA